METYIKEENKLDPAEIRKRIDFNNQQIEKAMSPNFFILNTFVRDLLNENARLQMGCLHHFFGGYCIFCDAEDPEWKQEEEEEII